MKRGKCNELRKPIDQQSVSVSVISPSSPPIACRGRGTRVCRAATPKQRHYWLLAVSTKPLSGLRAHREEREQERQTLQHADLPALVVGLSPPVRRRELRRGRRRPALRRGRPRPRGGRWRARRGSRRRAWRRRLVQRRARARALRRALRRPRRRRARRRGWRGRAPCRWGRRGRSHTGSSVVRTRRCQAHGQLSSARPPRLPLKALSRAGQPACEQNLSSSGSDGAVERGATSAEGDGDRLGLAARTQKTLARATQARARRARLVLGAHRWRAHRADRPGEEQRVAVPM